MINIVDENDTFNQISFINLKSRTQNLWRTTVIKNISEAFTSQRDNNLFLCNSI